MSRPIIKFSKRYGKVLGSINPDNHYPLYIFMYIIIMYALENNSAFNALSKHKLSAIHFVRMQVDCCLEVYACLLYRDKERFFKYFMDGKPTNKLCIGKQYLTAGYLCGELNKRYSGISEIYKEGCKWVHPSKVMYRFTAPQCDPSKSDMFFIGYKDKHYYDDEEQLRDIYKDMLLVNQILYELLKELVAPYKMAHSKELKIGKFFKSKKKMRFQFYE
ncbi:hypothetical protein ACMSDT_22150 [Bacteroides thetaiotaomicron]|uniref:hypothetical protein n=1 Tax=Bacteroides thetaiotaomicron TaxID=818 RepID=UPI002165B13F|nr:hypothetical protein [Bacteroides thetaiotaomicron]MCS2450927.1 hypothetical protein [Bacteroides thetaiotaomicron]